ncbi:MAG: DNA primase [Clostridia bacterium]|nr:DNA primase [Clostridia bacterium]
MSKRIPPEIVDEIIFKNPIEDVVSSYVNLKKAGSRYMGLCPFHNEKTPSFVVYPNTKSFYCFGCGAGGSAITFISRMENLTYYEALENLAERSGIQLPQDREYGDKDDNRPSKKRVLQMNLDAAKFFRQCLFDERIGAVGMKYLRDERKLDMSTIRHFGLGFAPNDFSSLTKHMKSLGYTEEELHFAFLCGKSQNGRYYDYFRNRVIFPIIDTAGGIIGFGGRVMDDSKPKYLNTSDTAAFKKSRNLFALNFAKNKCEDQLILCEGYMDVIAVHAAGFESAVATLGTALTEEQARVMARYTKKVIIAYDSDEAGRTASSRASAILASAGLEVRMLQMNGAKDPDEYIKKFGRIRFEGLINSSVSDFDYKRDALLASFDTEIPDQKIKAADKLCSVIATYHSGVARELYIADISKRLNIPADSLRSDVERKRSYNGKKQRDELKKEADRSIMMLGDNVNKEASKNPAAVRAEETILGVLLLDEDARKYLEKNSDAIREEDFFSEFSRELFRRIVELQHSDHGFSLALIEEGYTPDEFARVYSIYHSREQLSANGVQVMLEALKTLKQETDTSEDPIAAARKRMGL